VLRVSPHANRADTVVEAVVAGTGDVPQIQDVGRYREALALEVLVFVERRRPSGQHPNGGDALRPGRRLSLGAS